MSGSNYTQTPNYGLFKPVPNADNDVWGDHLNSNSDTLDSLIKTIQNSAGVVTFNTRNGAVTLTTADVTTVLPASGTAPVMDGTAAPGTATNWARGDHVHPTDTTRYAASNPNNYQTAAQVTTALGPYALIASPTFTGDPQAPTPATADNDTSIATTAFVKAQGYATSGSVPAASSTTPAMDGTAAVGTGTTWARADHIHPTDTSRAPLASPALTGTPTVPTAAAGTNTTQAASTAFVQAAAAPALTNVGRNLLHNSMFNIQQRGQGPWSVFGYTFDRWRFDLNLDTSTVQAAAMTDGSRTALGDESALWAATFIVTGNAGAAAYTLINQRIEDVRRLSGKTVTVSFWAATNSGTLKVGVSFDQYFGSGGSPSTTVNIAGQPITAGSVWTRYSLTFALPSVVGKTVGTNGDHSTFLHFWFSAGSNFNTRTGSIGVQSGTVNIWGCQLELGSAATPLEKLDPVLQLQQCQRFFQTGQIFGASYGVIGSAYQVIYVFPVIMRATPTFGITTNASSNISSFSLAGSPAWVYNGGAPTATGSVSVNCAFTASADL
jgi:hypothetical protein